MNNEDEYLVGAIRSGDAKAFERLFYKYYEELTRFACRYTHSMETAEGFVQQVYAKIWEMRDDLEISMNIRSYLFTSVKNEVLDRAKHEEVVKKYEEEVRRRLYDKKVYKMDPEKFSDDDFVELTKDAIDDLPDYTRKIYKMSRRDGFTYHEIASILDISIKTVEAHISKALRILRERLAQYLPSLLIGFFFYSVVA